MSRERKCWYLAWTSHLKIHSQPDQNYCPWKENCLGDIIVLCIILLKKKKSKRKKSNTKSEGHTASDISMESFSWFGSSVLFKSLTNGEPKVRTLVLMQWLQQHCVYAGISSSLSWPPAPSPSCHELLVWHGSP